MKLSELSPVYKKNSLKFLCPRCCDHAILVPYGTWKLIGDTLTPSVDTFCNKIRLHFNITAGEIVIHND